jgi:hypothetical protein
MTKITSEHLLRGACVYIRQSTADQLVHNQESQRSADSDEASHRFRSKPATCSD